MNGRDEELLSAYFDGELTGDEQSRAEQLLAENLAAREALDELADVSSRLRQLPRPPAPAGMREDVLRQLRARSALVKTPAADPRSRWRRPAAWIGSVAAGLLIAVFVYQQRPERERGVGPEVAAGTAVAMRESTVQSDGLQPLAPMGAVELDAYHGSPASTAASERFDVVSESLERQPQSPTTLALTNSLFIQDEFRQLVERGEAPVPGKVYSNVSQVDGQIVVTQHRVVDTEQLLGQIQVVLTDNGIVTLPDAVAESASRDQLAADTKQNGRLQAIYVEAPAINFYNAVQQIAQLASVTKVSANTVFGNEFDVARDGAAVEGKLATAGDADKQESQSQRFSASPAAGRESRRRLATNETEAAKPDSRSTGAPTAMPARRSLAHQDQPPAPPQSERQYLYQDLDASAESRSIAAYQVVVPARQELLEELQQQPAAFFDAEQPATAAPAEQSAVAKKAQSKVLQRLCTLPPQGIKAAPADPDRVRAVILLVPEQKP
ncbi:MAG: hypothetical protein U0992_07970 [Planctomycetaceae bacterium]